jgi:hypothetical protein
MFLSPLTRLPAAVVGVVAAGSAITREVVAKAGFVFFMKENPLQMQSTELI